MSYVPAPTPSLCVCSSFPLGEMFWTCLFASCAPQLPVTPSDNAGPAHHRPVLECFTVLAHSAFALHITSVLHLAKASLCKCEEVLYWVADESASGATEVCRKDLQERLPEACAICSC